MLRLFQIENPSQSKDFESNLFSSENKLHTIVFDYDNDTVTIDTVAYFISKIEEITYSGKSTSTTSNVTITDGNMAVLEQNSNPIDKYELNIFDDSISPAYFGYTHINLNNTTWYIAKLENKKFTYTKGSVDFEINWTDRVNLTYTNTIQF